MRKATIPLLITLFVSNQTGFSWGDSGHEIVARIAAKHLTPSASKAVADLLRQDSSLTLSANPSESELEDAMAKVATWPDHINKSATGTENWHFIDIGLLEDESAIAKRCGSSGDCVVEKITQLQANLKSGANMGTFQPFEELKFLIHFVGDIHQPLHAATNQDAGGNCVRTTGFGQKELHAVWDTGLVNEISKVPGQSKPQMPDVVAASLDKNISASDIASWSQVTDSSTIAMESHQKAIDHVYTPLKPADKKIAGYVEIKPGQCLGVTSQLQKTTWAVTGIYKKPSDDLVAKQLSMAGIRLAQILNDTFK